MIIYISALGQREFLVIEDVYSIPIDTITKIELHSDQDKKSEANSVCIYCGSMKYLFAFEDADSVREFIFKNKSGKPTDFGNWVFSQELPTKSSLLEEKIKKLIDHHLGE